jgi:Xaa-Pro aminopeptidase
MRLGGTGSKIVEVLREKGYDRANIGVVGLETYGPGEREGYVPYKTWACILDNLPHANFREVSAAFYKLVFIKSDEELQLVRKAAELGELAAEAMIKITHPGESESKIYAAVMNELFRNGGSGGVCRVSGDMILQSGPDNPGWGAPTWIFRGQPPRILKRGDVVQAEIFSVYGGMEAQLQMSVAIEPVDSVNRDCGAVAHHAYEVGLKALVPGKTFGEVVKEMEEPLRQAGAWYLTPLIHSLNPLRWISSTGVGIENLPGIERYEGIAPTPVIGGDLVIQPGTTWELEPNACLGKHRVNVGGTVIVTEEGAIGLNVLPTEMHVIV